MRLEWATICHRVDDVEDRVDLIGVCMDTLMMEEPLPSLIHQSLAAVVSAPAVEFGDGVHHQLTVDVTDGDGGEVGATDPFVFQTLPLDLVYPAEWDGRNVIPLTARFTATDEGDYTFAVSLDGGPAIRLAVRLLRLY